jgi:predicted transcriptional regulator
MSVNSQKVKFATQADPQLLTTLRGLARAEGRQLQALIDEALREYVERKQGGTPRRRVMAALDESLLQYDDLYRKLAE